MRLLLLLLLFLPWNTGIFATNIPSLPDTLTSQKMAEEPTVAAPEIRRQFDFDLPDLPLPTVEEDNLVPGQVQMQEETENMEARLRAKAIVDQAIAAGNFIQRLDELAWVEFPVVIPDTISNVPIAVVFDNLRLTPQYAELEVVVRMLLPQKKVSESVDSDYVELLFGVPSLKFSHDGGIIGDATLGLYGNTPIGMRNPEKFAFVLKGGTQETTDGQTQLTGTYVTINCDGFVSMGLDADVYFSRNWIVPVDAMDRPIAPLFDQINAVRLFNCNGIAGGQEVADIISKPVITSTDFISVNSSGQMWVEDGTMIKLINN